MEASLQKSDQLNRLLTTYRPLQDRSVFVVSNNRARVTIQSQQYRALNLVYLLHELQYVAPDKHIAILGGGVAGGTQDRPGAAPPVDGYHSEPILDLFMYPEGVDRNLPPYRTLMTAPVLATDGDGYTTIVAVVNVTSGQPYDFSAPDFGWLQSCCAALGQIFVIYEEFLPDSYSRSSTPTAPLPD